MKCDYIRLAPIQVSISEVSSIFIWIKSWRPKTLPLEVYTKKFWVTFAFGLFKMNIVCSKIDEWENRRGGIIIVAFFVFSLKYLLNIHIIFFFLITHASPRKSISLAHMQNIPLGLATNSKLENPSVWCAFVKSRIIRSVKKLVVDSTEKLQICNLTEPRQWGMTTNDNIMKHVSLGVPFNSSNPLIWADRWFVTYNLSGLHLPLPGTRRPVKISVVKGCRIKPEDFND